MWEQKSPLPVIIGGEVKGDTTDRVGSFFEISIPVIVNGLVIGLATDQFSLFNSMKLSEVKWEPADEGGPNLRMKGKLRKPKSGGGGEATSTSEATSEGDGSAADAATTSGAGRKWDKASSTGALFWGAKLEQLFEWGTKNVIVRCELACFDTEGKEITLGEWKQRKATAGAAAGAAAAGAGGRVMVLWQRRTGVGGSIKSKRSLIELQRIKIETDATELYPVAIPSSPATAISLLEAQAK